MPGNHPSSASMHPWRLCHLHNRGMQLRASGQDLVQDSVRVRVDDLLRLPGLQHCTLDHGDKTL